MELLDAMQLNPQNSTPPGWGVGVGAWWRAGGGGGGLRF